MNYLLCKRGIEQEYYYHEPEFDDGTKRHDTCYWCAQPIWCVNPGDYHWVTALHIIEHP